MKYQERCECCNHTTTAYTLGFNTPMAKAFYKFAEEYIKYGVALKKGEIGLRNEQYTNFQNLRHFGIIQQIDAQKWVLTTKGENFFQGLQPVTVPAAHLGGETLYADHKAWETHDKEREQVFIWQILNEAEYSYKQRHEFQAEKSPQTTLFNT